MSDLDSPLLLGLDDNCDDSNPGRVRASTASSFPFIPGRARASTASSFPFIDSLDSLLPVQGGVVLRRLLGVSNDNDNDNDNNNDNDNDIDYATTPPRDPTPTPRRDQRDRGYTRNSNPNCSPTPSDESHPPATITMNGSMAIHPDMEYDEHDAGDYEEEKSPTPLRTSPSHLSASSSITSSAMIFVQEDGLCTYAYYDEESWNGGGVAGTTDTTPLHHNRPGSQQSVPRQPMRPQHQQQRRDTDGDDGDDDNDDPFPRCAWRLRSVRNLQNPNRPNLEPGHGSGDSAKGLLTGFRPFLTTGSESESSFASQPNHHRHRGNNDSCSGMECSLETVGSMIPIGAVVGCGGEGSGGGDGGGSVESALNKQNVLNFVSLVGNLVLAGLVGVWKLNGRLRSVMEVWDDQQTLVSPARWLLIWPVIFLLETIFAFAQLTPSYRARPIVQEGISYFFIHACLGQICWMLFFSYELFLPALLSILYTLLSLLSLKLSQDFVLSMHRAPTTRTNRTNPNILGVGGLLTKMKQAEYWFLRFPFHLHLGWTVVVASVTLAIFVVRCGSSGVVELTASLVILSVWLLVAFFFVIVLAPGGGGALDFTIPLVVILAYVGIGVALRNPSETLITRFNGDEISGLSATSFALAILVGLLVMPGVAFRIFREHFTINVTQVE